MAGGAGDDLYILSAAADVTDETGGGGVDSVRLTYTVTAPTTLTAGSGPFAGIENISVATAVGVFHLQGDAEANLLVGNASANSLSGADGDDTLDGGVGNDVLVGGLGNDLYVINAAADVTDEVTDGGGDADTVRAAVTVSLLDASRFGIEHVELTGALALNATGDEEANLLVGNSGNNSLVGNLANDTLRGNAGADTLDGGIGADDMDGGAGADLYLVDQSDDIAVESGLLPAGGVDRVNATADYTLGANIEHLALFGAALRGTGNGGNNSITGNAGANTLSGGAGNDTLAGGAGQDLYFVDTSLDIIQETLASLAEAERDTVRSSAVAYTLAANLEQLFLEDGAVSGVGNTLANLITGNSGDNTLDGAAGVDSMAGGAGNDFYALDSVSELALVQETADAGVDTLRLLFSVAAPVTIDLSGGVLGNFEHVAVVGTGAFNLIGNAAQNSLSGNASANTLDGGAGNDTLTGGAGNDSYIVDGSDDLIVELVNGGVDTVLSSASYTLTANVERLQLTGTGAIDGTGNSLANSITGNSGANRLDGGAGVDTLTGGEGNDTYVLTAGDVIVETLAGSGAGLTDTVVAAASYTLAANLENLELRTPVVTMPGSGGGVVTSYSHLTGTGNAADNYLLGDEYNNVLRGMAGNDTLEGRGGGDTLVGGAGNDRYIFGANEGAVIDESGGGIDTISSATHDIAGAVGVEVLMLEGSADLDAYGSDTAEHLIGNSGANWLYGRGGIDTLQGGGGNDLYSMVDLDDLIIEEADGGFDTVNVQVFYTLPENVEAVQVGVGTNIGATGNELANIMRGREGNNHFVGGAGNDELQGEAGNDTLDGGTGRDVLMGGLGNDLFIVDNALEQASDMSAGGTEGGNDTVQASVDYTLGPYLEHLQLTGASAIDGAGNELQNTLTGNDANNALSGLDGSDTITAGLGDDTLDGGAGSDTLIGGAGNDTYVIGATSAQHVLHLDNWGPGYHFTSDSGSFNVNASDWSSDADSLVDTVTVSFNGSGHFFSLDMSTRKLGVPLAPGTFDNIMRYPFESNGRPGLWLAGDGSGSNTSSGSFVVEQAEFLFTGGAWQIVSFVAEFTHFGDGGPARTGYVQLSTIGTGNDSMVELADGGVDRVVSSGSHTLAANLEDLELTGTYSARGTGNALANAITGNEAGNTLDGAAGADTLDGGDGNDTLIGGDGNDFFCFESPLGPANVDRITDFSSGDLVALSVDRFGAAGGIGALAGSRFHSGAGANAAADADHRIVYDTTNGNLYYDADGVGGDAAVLFAVLENSATLSADSFSILQ
jgi:Ca2+-binding RTX toxin-like protein